MNERARERHPETHAHTQKTHRIVVGGTARTHAPHLVGSFRGPGEDEGARVAIKAVGKPTHGPLFDEFAYLFILLLRERERGGENSGTSKKNV